MRKKPLTPLYEKGQPVLIYGPAFDQPEHLEGTVEAVEYCTEEDCFKYRISIASPYYVDEYLLFPKTQPDAAEDDGPPPTFI